MKSEYWNVRMLGANEGVGDARRDACPTRVVKEMLKKHATEWRGTQGNQPRWLLGVAAQFILPMRRPQYPRAVLRTKRTDWPREVITTRSPLASGV